MGDIKLVLQLSLTMNKLSILFLVLSISTILCSTRQLRRTALFGGKVAEWADDAHDALTYEEPAPVVAAEPVVEPLTAEEEFNNFVDSVTGGLTAMKMQVQQFLKTLLAEVTDESVKGCVRDLGYWNQVTIDAIKDNTPMQTFVEKVAVPMVDCSQKTETESNVESESASEDEAVEVPAVEEPTTEVPAVEEPTTTEGTTTTDAGDFDLTDFDFGARRAQTALEPEAADDATPVAPAEDTTPVAPADEATSPADEATSPADETEDDNTTPVEPTPAPAKETLDSILDAWA